MTKETKQEFVAPVEERELDEVAGGSTGAGAGKVTFNPFAAVKGDPSQWGVQGDPSQWG